MSSGRPEGKRALITGAASGLGAAIAARFVAEGVALPVDGGHMAGRAP